jgi:hypothetical protein
MKSSETEFPAYTIEDIKLSKNQLDEVKKESNMELI